MRFEIFFTRNGGRSIEKHIAKADSQDIAERRVLRAYPVPIEIVRTKNLGAL